MRARRQGTSQQEVADNAGTSLPPVSEVETGATNYKVDTLIRIAHAHGVDLSKLL